MSNFLVRVFTTRKYQMRYNIVQHRVGHGSIFADPIQSNPSTHGPNPSFLKILTQSNPIQSNPWMDPIHVKLWCNSETQIVEQNSKKQEKIKLGFAEY